MFTERFVMHVVIVGTMLGGTVALAQWIELTEAPARLDAAPDIGAADFEEKDYAWGDVDGDGDDDLIVVRKQPFTTPGRRRNVLLLNENGVLTDRTEAFATASDVAGDQGFLTPTNDRDVVLVDVDGDGWLDIVTSVTLTDAQPKHISHPRVYMNLGEVDGAWRGFRYENDRIPTMHEGAGPRFCGVSAGDITGDGAPDLFFSDYDSGGAMIFDFNDRLLVNDGQGFFTDETTTRLTPAMYTSAFGITNRIVDMNGDGLADIIRLTALGLPYHIGIAYNDPDHAGFFSEYEMIYTFAAYEFEVGELNGDGRLDVVVADDGNDRYLLNQGNDAQGHADFLSHLMPPSTLGLFSGNIVIEDLDRDGWNDIIAADADTDIPGCSARTFLFHNQGDPPDVTFDEGPLPIPEDMLRGVHDVATIDLDGDGWLDLVLGRCTGTQVWMNVPPVGLEFAYPGGVPARIPPGAATTIELLITGFGGAVIEPGSALQHVSVDGAPFTTTPLDAIEGDHYAVTLTTGDCPGDVRFYVTAGTTAGGAFQDPPDAPASTRRVLVATGIDVAVDESFEGDVSAWTVEGEDISAGAWEAAAPNGTIASGMIAAPDEDATPGPGNVTAFVTGNGLPGGAAGTDDVDGGPTHLLSPAFDLDGDSIVSFARWFFCDDDDDDGQADFLTLAVSPDDGVTWIDLPSLTTAGTDGMWETASFVVSDHVSSVPATLRLRFSTADVPNNSITEAGIDDVRIETLTCACTGDLDGDGLVGFGDLLEILSAWGPCPPGCVADLDDDGAVGFGDLLVILSVWGACP